MEKKINGLNENKKNLFNNIESQKIKISASDKILMKKRIDFEKMCEKADIIKEKILTQLLNSKKFINSEMILLNKHLRKFTYSLKSLLLQEE